jgi:hypothetical protein
MDLHLVTSVLQILIGIMVDIMQLIHEVHRIVSNRFFLVGQSPEQQVTGIAIC